MSGMAVAQRMTVAEYLAQEDERRRTDLVDGEVVVNEPRPLHQRIMVDLLVALTLWTRAGVGRGEVTAPIDVQLDEHNCFGPDVLWYRELARGDALTSPLLPGFSLPLDELFGSPPGAATG